MIEYSKFTLSNGLRILVNEDRSTPLVAMNILYDVGSRDEEPDMTGLAHLFEHLMFGGSVNIPDYDRALQLVGGENNAFTNNDITDYYLTIPAENIETGFWLESDRMLGLAFSKKALDIQKSVVIEEYNQRYLNQPYGDAILLLRPMAYKIHPYRWPTIGADKEHIEKVSLDYVRNFFFSHYAPNNAVLALSGKISAEEALNLSEKWFGPIEKRNIPGRKTYSEPPQSEERRMTVERDVPFDALYKIWHTCGRLSPDFFTLDLITDLLAGGDSGRLYRKLVREKKLFSEINAYITSDLDPGLLILQGNLISGISLENAEEAVNDLISEMKNLSSLQNEEIVKVKNKFESSSVFSNTNILNRSMNLSYYELTGRPDLINRDVELFTSVTAEMAAEAAARYINPENCCTLYYKSAR